MIDESNLLSLNEQKKNINQKDLRIMKIQQNLIQMGFDITMINKIITYFKINTEAEALDYLIKSENGMWNHPFIPQEEDPNEQNINILEQPKNVMSNVLTKINSLKRTSTFNTRKSLLNIKDDDEEDNNIIKTKNSKNIINVEKIINEDICEICGEPKEFHNIKEFNQPIIINEDDKNEIENNNNNKEINIINENSNNINNEDKEEEEDEKEDPNLCQICMDDFENPIEIENCKHKFCQECFHQYLVDKIKHNQIEQIPCPKKNCKTKNLSENFFSQFLTEQEYFKYRQFKAQNEIAKDSKKVFCPLCDSYANIEEGQDLMYDSNNPDYIKSTLKCQNGHEFCSCGRPKHEGDCYRDEKEFKEFLVTEKIKKCPKCGFLIKKNKGCNHMTCGNPICKYEFCWLCMQEAVPNHFDYGPCEGKQFFDPDSFSYQLKQNHPCLYCLYSLGMVLFYFVIISVAGIAVPGIGLSILAYILMFEGGALLELKNSSRVIIFFGYVCMGFGYQNILHVLWGLAFAFVGIIISVTILNIIFELLKAILNCLFCGICEHEHNDNIDS